MLWILGWCQASTSVAPQKHAQNPSALPKALRAAKRSARRERFFSSLLLQRLSVSDFGTTEVDALTRTVLFYLSKP